MADDNNMRLISLREKKQRGCECCLDMKPTEIESRIRTACPFAKCPYEVLDKYKTYEEFMESEDSMILATEYFTTIASCYELSQFPHAPKGIFEDKGDFKMHL